MNNYNNLSKLPSQFTVSPGLLMKRLTTINRHGLLGLLSVTDPQVLNNPELFMMGFTKHPSLFQDIFNHLPIQLLHDVDLQRKIYHIRLVKTTRYMGLITDSELLLKLLTIDVAFIENCHSSLKKDKILMMRCVNLYPELLRTSEDITVNYIHLQFAVRNINGKKAFLLCTTVEGSKTYQLNGHERVKKSICDFLGDFQFSVIDQFYDTTPEILRFRQDIPTSYTSNFTRVARLVRIVKYKKSFKLIDVPRYVFPTAQSRLERRFQLSRRITDNIVRLSYSVFKDLNGVYPNIVDKRECIRIIKQFASSCGFNMI